MTTHLTPYFSISLYTLRISFLLFPLSLPITITASEQGFSFLQSTLISLFVCSLISTSLLAFIARMYRGTTFEIGDTGVSYRLNFFWSRNKEILFLNIKEIELKSGVLQRLFGLGALVIHTQATAAGNNRAGIVFFDIPTPEKAYKILKDRVYKAQHLSRK